MSRDEIIDWLLEGDVSIQYQTYRDLLGIERTDLRSRIAREGWGAEFLVRRNSSGHWGLKFYQPKWISSHYTLLDLRNLCIEKDHPTIHETLGMIIQNEKGPDGGVLPIGTTKTSDVCVNGMFLNYAAFFNLAEESLKSIIDFLLKEHMPDGGFNCRSNRSGAVHSSLHSSISVLEGLYEYESNNYGYRIIDVKKARLDATEFILLHQLYLSDRTGEVIHPDFLRLPYPSRWRYDILRALDYFRHSTTPWDDRMKRAIDHLLRKRTKDGRWKLNAKYPGKVHFDMEQAGKPSRWNTLRSLRVLEHYNIPYE